MALFGREPMSALRPLLRVIRTSRRHRRMTGSDPDVWSGRAVQEALSTWLMRSCINVSGLCLERVVLRAIMDISAHASLVTGQASTGPKGSPVLACAGKTEPPSSSCPLADLGGQTETKLHH